MSSRPGRVADTVAVVFDLDGTLVDSEPVYYEASRLMLAEYGITDFTWEDHADHVGISTLDTVTLWRRRYGIGAPPDMLLAELNDRYLRLARTAMRAYPEMRTLVQRLHTAEVPMIVASGSSRAAISAVLSGTGLDALLTAAVSADEVARGKPAPDVFLEAARRLGAAPEHCVVVEDAAPGAAAAHAAGMRCIAVPYLPAHADDPAFAATGLLFRGGQREFTADAAWDWILQTAH